MRRFQAFCGVCILLICLMVGYVHAEVDMISASHGDQATDYYFTYVKQVDEGSWTYTNDFVYPWKLGDVAFTLSTPLTNTFTITHYRVWSTNSYQGNVVSTNVFDETVTNYFQQVTNTATWIVTNQVYSVVETNLTGGAHIYSDLPEIYVLKNDRLKFDFTQTNKFHFLLDGKR